MFLILLCNLQFPSVFSLYISNKEASYDLAPVPTATAIHSANNSTLNLVKSENGYYCKGQLPINGNNGYMQHYASTAVSKSKQYDSTACRLNDYWSTTCVLAWKNFTRLRRNIP